MKSRKVQPALCVESLERRTMLAGEVVNKTDSQSAFSPTALVAEVSHVFSGGRPWDLAGCVLVEKTATVTAEMKVESKIPQGRRARQLHFDQAVTAHLDGSVPDQLAQLNGQARMTITGRGNVDVVVGGHVTARLEETCFTDNFQEIRTEKIVELGMYAHLQARGAVQADIRLDAWQDVAIDTVGGDLNLFVQGGRFTLEQHGTNNATRQSQRVQHLFRLYNGEVEENEEVLVDNQLKAASALEFTARGRGLLTTSVSTKIDGEKEAYAGVMVRGNQSAANVQVFLHARAEHLRSLYDSDEEGGDFPFHFTRRATQDVAVGSTV